MNGYGGNDTLRSGYGNDTLYGNQGDDDLANGGGYDIIFGGQGNDLIASNAGRDVMYGNMGNDTIKAAMMSCTLYGGQGDDVIYGYRSVSDVPAADLIFGNLGNDTLYGFGADTMHGGSGADRFVLVKGAGVIRDFNGSEGDRLNFGIANTSSISVTKISSGVKIEYSQDLSTKVSVTLEGVSYESFDRSWIVG